jgi:hypothetical protein
MLTITIRTNDQELWDEATESFIVDTSGDVILELEHSLVTLSKWESKFKKPFLGTTEKTEEEIISYVKFMISTPDIPLSIVEKLSQQNVNDINAYIESKESATTFGKIPERKSRGETITAELIYYWMIAFNIPFECQHWHLNRLFSLIQICNIKNSKPEKQSRHAMAQRNRELNEQRRKEFGTTG